MTVIRDQHDLLKAGKRYADSDGFLFTDQITALPGGILINLFGTSQDSHLYTTTAINAFINTYGC